MTAPTGATSCGAASSWQWRRRCRGTDCLLRHSAENPLRAAGASPLPSIQEAGVALPDRNDTFYVANLAVICEPLRPEDRLIRNPVLIVEVSSPSTAAIDRQIKVSITAAFLA
jgi:hypothetical protein